MNETELPVCPSCRKANRMKVGWLKTQSEGFMEVEVVECQKCGWTGPKSDVKTGRSENQATIDESFT